MEPVEKGILILTPFYSPNIGGVETHLLDLTEEIVKNGNKVFVLTYTPLTTQNLTYQSEEFHKNLYIKRFRWIGRNLFHILEKFPFFDFLYLTPYLFLRSLVWMTANSQKIDVIHSQGINAAVIGNILAKFFNKKHITSTHAIYENITGLSQKVSVYAFNQTSAILCLSKKSIVQLKSWGVNPNLLHQYKYWINLQKFKPANLSPKNFTILYVGRLINKKGIPQLLKAASKLPMIDFIFAGNGPSSQIIQSYCNKYSNIRYLGPISYEKLPQIYQQTSLVCIPSQYPEGFGRVVMESVASGIPVIGSNYGSISEAVDDSVSILFKPTVKNIISAIHKLSTNHSQYLSLKRNCRKFALKNFSNQNYSLISKFY